MELQLTDPYYALKLKAWESLRLVMDPELDLNIVDLGLIYELKFLSDEQIKVNMTLTSRECPLGDSIIQGVLNNLQQLFPCKTIQITLVWDPMWSADSISEAGKQQLRIK